MGRRVSLVVIGQTWRIGPFAAAGVRVMCARVVSPFTRPESFVDGRPGGPWRGYRFQVAITAAANGGRARRPDPCARGK